MIKFYLDGKMLDLPSGFSNKLKIRISYRFKKRDTKMRIPRSMIKRIKSRAKTFGFKFYIK